MELAFLIARLTLLSLVAGAWLAPAAWVAADARARGSHLGRIGLLPLAGPVAWLLLRPDETLADRRLRRARRRWLEEQLGEYCLHCRTPVKDDFRCCPGCGEELRRSCGCGRLLRAHWVVCPWCATEPAGARASAA